MADFNVILEGMDKATEEDLRTKLLTMLQGVKDHVTHAWFAGSGGGSQNFDLGDVKGTNPSPAEVAAAANPPAQEPVGDLPGEPTTEGPAPVTTGIDPATLGAPGPVV